MIKPGDSFTYTEEVRYNELIDFLVYFLFGYTQKKCTSDLLELSYLSCPHGVTNVKAEVNVFFVL